MFRVRLFLLAHATKISLYNIPMCVHLQHILQKSIYILIHFDACIPFHKQRFG